MAANDKKIFIGPAQGAHLPVLDITHKITAESFGGAFTTHPARASHSMA